MPDGGHGRQQQRGDADEEHPAPAAVMDQRTHHAAVEFREEILGVFGWPRCSWLSLGGVPSVSFEYFFAPAQDADRGPRRDDEGDQQRPEHRRARTDRDRPHVGPHQAADEGHRQHRGDHREGGEDGGIADFTDGLDRDGGPVAALVLRQVEMPDDVFHHHDGVIHQDADAEDQREERDAVEGETIEIENQQGERQRGRNGDRDDADSRASRA